MGYIFLEKSHLYLTEHLFRLAVFAKTPIIELYLLKMSLKAAAFKKKKKTRFQVDLV